MSTEEKELKKEEGLQNTLLNSLRKDKTECTIKLLNGVTLYGYIKGFDNHVIQISSNSRCHPYSLQYKHGISSILPGVDPDRINQKKYPENPEKIYKKNY